MSSQSSFLLFSSNTTTVTAIHSFPTKPPSKLFSGFSGSYGDKDKEISFPFRQKCKAISNPRTEEYTDVFPNGLPLIRWHEKVEVEEKAHKISISEEIVARINEIKMMLLSMEDGEISVSAYDTAWVALVEDINGSGSPQFPSVIHWIVNNQLADGSWGDRYIFSPPDRIINTLACVMALKRWDIYPEKCRKGLSFIEENLCKIGNENAEHMPIGFEIAFPSLIEVARSLDIEVPDNSPVLQDIYAKRNLKLTRIPREIMHKVPTTILHSLEGMAGLDWEKLMNLQCADGSFLFSPSSTAFALMQTKDENCLGYLEKAVERFHGGVPNVYPVDLFEHLWAVDRIQRLGISRYFQTEIKGCLDYVYRYWTEKGICWARNSVIHDIDDTAMGFRLLRLQGYDVSSDVFRYFMKEGEFFSFVGQSTEAITGMFNLYRASQVMFPGEKILEEARKFSTSFLRRKQACNELLDKWIMTKDLPGEVGYALDVPWYASLPRVEARHYIEQYGGEDDVWIGKTLYRMPNVNNNTYLELAKLDYNNCQALHRLEWNNMQKWYTECNLGDYGLTRRRLLYCYFMAVANIFEPERFGERFAWAKTAALMEAISSYFNKEGISAEQRLAFVNEFDTITTKQGYLNNDRTLCRKKTGRGLVGTLLATLNRLSLDALVAHGRDVRQDLRHAWEKWLTTWQEEGDGYKGEAELLMRTIELSAGRWASEELLSHPHYLRLSALTSSLCRLLRHHAAAQQGQDKGCNNTSNGSITAIQIESDMQELVQLVVGDFSDGISPDTKQMFLSVTKSFYYRVYCSPATIRSHIAKVLFERVD